MTCPGCGYEMDASVLACPHCGRARTAASTAPEQLPTQAVAKNPAVRTQIFYKASLDGVADIPDAPSRRAKPRNEARSEIRRKQGYDIAPYIQQRNESAGVALADIDRRCTDHAAYLDNRNREIINSIANISTDHGQISRLKEEQGDAQWVKQDYDAAYAERERITSGAYWFEALPVPLTTTHTDSQGHFELTVPIAGDVVIGAQTTDIETRRQLCWLRQQNVRHGESKTIALTNENTLAAHLPDSLVKNKE